MEYVELGSRGRHLVLKIKIFCASCKRPYQVNARHGFSLIEPTIDFEGDLTVPLSEPASDDSDPVDGDPQINQISDNKIVH